MRGFPSRSPAWRGVIGLCLAVSFLPARAQPACEKLPRWARSWWAGDGSSIDLLGRNTPDTTLGAPAYVPAQVSQGFKFAGGDGYVVSNPSILDIRFDGTFTAWLRVDGTTAAGEDVVVDKRSGEFGPLVGYTLFVDGAAGPSTATFRFRLYDRGTVQEVATPPVALGELHHVAVVTHFPRGTVAIYLDGRLAEMQRLTVPDVQNSGGFYIGHPSQEVTTAANPFDGVVDELMFAGAITPCQIGAQVAAGTAGHCRGDVDVDGVADYADNCPELANPTQANDDYDFAGNACDCAPWTYGMVAPPNEVVGVTIAADLVPERVGWCSSDDQAGEETLYTVARGRISELPVGSGASEICLAAAIFDSRWPDPQVPPPGDGFWYLSRANNHCGVGTYGFNSTGAPRGGPVLDSCALSEEDLCVQTGGFWDPTTCLHYTCGVENDCDGIIPGCDCGFTRNFVDGVGCQDDPRC